MEEAELGVDGRDLHPIVRVGDDAARGSAAGTYAALFICTTAASRVSALRMPQVADDVLTRVRCAEPSD